MADSPKIPDDELTKRLREAVRRKRPWDRLRVSLAILIFGLPVGFLAWWFWPRNHPPEMLVIGVDQVVAAGNPVQVRAALEPASGASKRWSGLDLFFEDMALPSSVRGAVVKAKTDGQGVAQTELRLKSELPMTEVEARYLDNRMRPPYFDRARCRVFTWPGDAKLLVVDIEPTLRKAVDWPSVARALVEAQKAGWQLVYLAIDADTPAEYRQRRDWAVQQEVSRPDALPAGPVLGRQKLFSGESEDAARTTVLAALKAEFGGPVVFAKSLQELKLNAAPTK
jgi:hypothetical protein